MEYYARINWNAASLLRKASEATIDTSLSYDELLHQLFELQVDAHPSQIAVECGDTQLTYAELDERANQLAHYLRKLGVERGSYVALLLERSPEIYVSMLAVMKCGAAYVPLDPEYPDERINYILRDSKAEAVLTTSSVRKIFDTAVHIIYLDVERYEIARHSAERFSIEEINVTPDDVCYIIYTSGTTGKPKGVEIEHRSICNFVRAERTIFQIKSPDRVYQGLSVSFDASLEEIWLAFFAGATLVAATKEVAQSGPDIARYLRTKSVTVVSTVPTVFSMVEEEIPSLRLLIFGGEACPKDLVKRWWKPGRQIFNTYGPTETTVTATYTELHPDKPVTIGKPLPNYQTYALDENLQRAERGKAGELYIGGIGLARGYVGLPELTQEKFITNPFDFEGEAPRMYKTGDLVRENEDGNLEFLGRMDSQVKLRGYRIELSEIESVLLECSDVKAASVTLHEDKNHLQQLVAYLVPIDHSPFDFDSIRATLRSRLPAYMIPTHFETVAELPTMPSGKIDRQALPPPLVSSASKRKNGVSARTPAEKKLLECWEQLFSPTSVSIHDDFFLDLGGHSLLAARMVSEMRRQSGFHNFSVLDVYQNPTIEQLAATIESRRETETRTSMNNQQRRSRRTYSRFEYLMCGALQSIGLYFVFGFRAAQWITPYLVYFLLEENGHSLFESVAYALVSAVTVFPVLALSAVAIKWLVLGKIRAGNYRLWSWYYFRWWFVQAIIGGLPLEYLAGTPLLPFFYRLLGAKIGNNVHIGTDRLAAFDLISIGAGTSIDDEVSLFGYTVENGELVLGPIQIGHGCFVGTWSVLSENTVLEDGARIEDLSLVPRGTQVPRGETWAGSPARKKSGATTMTPPPKTKNTLHRAAIAILYSVLVLVTPIVLLAAIVPGVIVLTHIDPLAHPLLYLFMSPLVGASFVLFITTEMVILKRLLVGRVRAGTYPVHGGFYIRNWVVEQLLAMSIDVVGQLHATLWLPPWFRALGAKLGEFVELSTANTTTPDLLDIGDECTIADEVSLGAAHVENGWMKIAPTQLGKRVFIGNSAVVPQGITIGDRSLVGVLSIAPTDAEKSAQQNCSWLGSPPLLLPNRQPSGDFSEQQTFRPTRKLRMMRRAIEIFRITFPPAGFILVTATVIIAALALWNSFGLIAAIALLPLVYAACSFFTILGIAIIKWIVMGRFHPFERPLWCDFIWRLEFVNALYEFLATPLALEALQGTPFLPWYLRLFGAKIGREVYIHTTGFLEFDLVHIGDRVALNDDCIMQTHLFEDRILKASTIRIGDDCSVGTVSVVLYDTTMEEGSRLDTLSLLMKGETLPAGTMWAGSPVSQQAKQCSETSTASRRPFRKSKRALPIFSLRAMRNAIPNE